MEVTEVYNLYKDEIMLVFKLITAFISTSLLFMYILPKHMPFESCSNGYDALQLLLRAALYSFVTVSIVGISVLVVIAYGIRLYLYLFQ